MNDKICHSSKESNGPLEEILRLGEVIVRGNAKIKADAENNNVELSDDEVITRLIESIIGKVESEEGSEEEDSVISVELRNPKTGDVGVLYSASRVVDYDVIRSLFAFYHRLMDISNITVVVVDAETGVERYTADVSPFGSINNIYLEPEEDEGDGAEELEEIFKLFNDEEDEEDEGDGVEDNACPPTLEEIVKLLFDTPDDEDEDEEEDDEDDDDFFECEGYVEDDPVMTVSASDGTHVRIYTHRALEIYLDHTAGGK